MAVYERGSFVPAWTPSHAERLIRSPDGFEVRQCRIDGQRREVVKRLAGTLLPSTARKPSLLGVVRGLVRFVAKLTPYARRTLRISQAREGHPGDAGSGSRARAVGFRRPSGGVRLSSVRKQSDRDDQRRIDDFVGALEAGLREIRDAYPALLARACAALANRLSLPGDRAELAAELRSRASQVGMRPSSRGSGASSCGLPTARSGRTICWCRCSPSSPTSRRRSGPMRTRTSSRYASRTWRARSAAPNRSWSTRTERPADRRCSDWRWPAAAVPSTNACFRCGPPTRIGLQRSAIGFWTP